MGWSAQDKELNKIAGNSIAIPTVGAILAVLLAATEPMQGSTTESPSRRKRPNWEMSVPTWIGLGRVSPNAGKFDCLLHSGSSSAADQKNGQQTMDRFVKRRKV